jgi:hypothetical protein
MILNFGSDGAAESPPPEEEKSVAVAEKEKVEEDDVAPLGLWGMPQPPGDAEKFREIAPKRRWTVNERA